MLFISNLFCCFIRFGYTIKGLLVDGNIFAKVRNDVDNYKTLNRRRFALHGGYYFLIHIYRKKAFSQNFYRLF